MMGLPNGFDYVRQLAWQVKWQADRVNELAEKVKALEKEVELLKERGSVHVDRIEYRFDQLKVERLEGALHIGITPEAGKSIGDLVVNQKEVGLTPEPEQPYADIRADIDAYLRGELPQMIESLETQHRFPLGTNYRQMIVDDIERQVEERIRHYLNHCPTDESSAEPADVRATVKEKVKRDIRSAVERHFRMFPRGGEGQHETGSGQ